MKIELLTKNQNYVAGRECDPDYQTICGPDVGSSACNPDVCSCGPDYGTSCIPEAFE